MKRRVSRGRSSWTSVATTSLVAILSLVVLWQAGHSFLPAGDAAPVTPATTREQESWVTTSDVNLRTGPGTSHDVLDVLPARTTLAVTGVAVEGFAPIRFHGEDAWISTAYIAPEGSVAAQATEMAEVPQPPEPTVEPTVLPTQIPAPAVPEAREEIGIPDDPGVSGNIPAEVVVSDTVVVDDTPVEDVVSGERWIEIDRSVSTVTLHDGDRIVAVYDGLMGKDPSPDGYYSTAVGTHYVFSMNRELTETPFAPGVYLTDWVGFDPERSNGIHSPVRDAAGNVVVTGGTTTLGCVRLGADEARMVFDFAFIGMRVEVHD